MQVHSKLYIRVGWLVFNDTFSKGRAMPKSKFAENIYFG